LSARRSQQRNRLVKCFRSEIQGSRPRNNPPPNACSVCIRSLRVCTATRGIENQRRISVLCSNLRRRNSRTS
jgi:hypothetical protein